MNRGTLLMLDEHRPELRDIAAFLRKENYDIQNFDRSNDIVKSFQKWDVDLVILPLDLSIQKALKLCYTIKSSSFSADTFVIFVSRHKSEYCVLAAFEAGADDFMYLPINRRLLVQKIQAILRRRRSYTQQAS